MWKLTIHQDKPINVEDKEITVEQEITFEDENPNNLLDIVRYLNECETQHKTWYTLKSEGQISTTIYNMNGVR